MEGLRSPKAMPNLNIKSKGLNHAATYLPHLSRCPLMTSKTFCSIPIFETKAYKVIAYASYPYHDPETANKVTLSWLNKTTLVCLVEKHKKYQANDSQMT